MSLEMWLTLTTVSRTRLIVAGKRLLASVRFQLPVLDLG